MEPIINIQNQYSQHINEPLQALPEEIKMLIFSQLNEMDIEQASKIKPWNKIFVDVVKKQEFEKLKAFVNWTIAQLKSDEFIEVKFKLKEALNGTKILESANLLDVKSSTRSLEKQILQILKALDVNTLDRFYLNLCKHKNLLIRAFFAVAMILKKIENIEISDRYLDQSIYDDALGLANLKQYDVALEVGQYASELKKQTLLSIIVTNLTNDDRINKALDIMNTHLESMSTISINNSICNNIVGLPLKNGQIYKTMEFAITLLKMKKIDSFIKSTNLILFKSICKNTNITADFLAQFPIFKAYMEELLNCKYPFIEREYILEDRHAGLIPTSVLKNISLEFIKEGKERESIIVAKMINNPEVQKQTLIAIRGEENSDPSCIVM